MILLRLTNLQSESLDVPSQITLIYVASPLELMFILLLPYLIKMKVAHLCDFVACCQTF